MARCDLDPRFPTYFPQGQGLAPTTASHSSLQSYVSQRICGCGLFTNLSCEDCGPKEASTMAQLPTSLWHNPLLFTPLSILLPFWPMPALGAELLS